MPPKYEGRHGVVIFDQHDPLGFDEELVIDLLETGREWAERGRAEEPAASAYLLIWNGGPRAGRLDRAWARAGDAGAFPLPARRARSARGRSPTRTRRAATYFTDLVAVHRALGLVVAEAEGVAHHVDA